MRYWAVIMEDWDIYNISERIGITWDKKHPEDKRKEESVMVMAIYPRKKDALSDVKFRGSSFVKEVEITII